MTPEFAAWYGRTTGMDLFPQRTQRRLAPTESSGVTIEVMQISARVEFISCSRRRAQVRSRAALFATWAGRAVFF